MSCVKSGRCCWTLRSPQIEPTSVRWLSLDEAIQAILTCWPALVGCLGQQAAAGNPAFQEETLNVPKNDDNAGSTLLSNVRNMATLYNFRTIMGLPVDDNVTVELKGVTFNENSQWTPWTNKGPFTWMSYSPTLTGGSPRIVWIPLQGWTMCSIRLSWNQFHLQI